MRLHIQHRTTYTYAGSASYSIQTLKLTPRRDRSQRSLQWRIQAPGRRIEQQDAFGNITHLLTLEGPHSEVVIQAEGVVETDGQFNGLLPAEGVLSPLVYANATPLTTASDSIASLARGIFANSTAVRANAVALMDAVASRVQYQPGTTTVMDSASDVMARGEGVCQDQAHVALALCRAAGIPARYVSGYILVDDDAHAASHAWVDLWLQGEQAWLGCDVTHQQIVSERLCRLAVGRDFRDAAPVRGVRRGGGREQLTVQVQVVASDDQ
jgi:transglutaminase-like putative cysteine protease